MNAKTSVCLPLLAALLCHAREDYTRNFQKTVPLSAGQRVEVQHRMGDIAVRTHAQRELDIRAFIRTSADDVNQARNFADRINISVESAGGTLLIRTEYPESDNGFFQRNNVSYSVRYEITMPETAPLQLRNAFGRVTVSGLKADAVVSNSNGSVVFRDGRGTQRLENTFGSVEVANNSGGVTVQNSNGAVSVSDVTGSVNVRDRFGAVKLIKIGSGATVVNSNGAVELYDAGGVSNITTSFGSVLASNVRAGVTIHNSNGEVEARTVAGPAELSTSFGTVRFSDVTGTLAVKATNTKVLGANVGEFATIETTFGSVDFRSGQKGARVITSNSGVTLSDLKGDVFVRASFGHVRAERIGGVLTVENRNGGISATGVQGAKLSTSFGSTNLTELSGPVEVESSNGSVIISARPAQSCRPVLVKTSFAPIKIQLSGDTNYDLSARTSFGTISTNLPITVSGVLSKDALTGKIGRGGCEMRLHNSNGGIEILGDSK